VEIKNTATRWNTGIKIKMGKLADLLLTEEEQNPTVKFKLYCDMDGVLCDFDQQFMKLLNDSNYGGKHYRTEELEGINTPSEFESKFGGPEFWKFIDEICGKKFWAEMEFTPGGQQLWNVISEYKPTLLTSPSRNMISRIGKRSWVKSHLTPSPQGIIFKYSSYKQQVAEEDVSKGLEPILIDDRRDIIDRWQDAGGIGIHHPKNGDPSEVIKRIKKLYGESTQEGI
jgi:hypothetical protein